MGVTEDKQYHHKSILMSGDSLPCRSFYVFLNSHKCFLSTPCISSMICLILLNAVRELLSLYKFPGDDIEVVRGSALNALNGTNDTIGKDAVLKLMEAVEKSVPTPKRETDKDFLMPVEDTFSISGRGTVVTGRIETGVIKVGDELEVVGLKAPQKSTCTGMYSLKMFSPLFICLLLLGLLLGKTYASLFLLVCSSPGRET